MKNSGELVKVGSAIFQVNATIMKHFKSDDVIIEDPSTFQSIINFLQDSQYKFPARLGFRLSYWEIPFKPSDLIFETWEDCKRYPLTIKFKLTTLCTYFLWNTGLTTKLVSINESRYLLAYPNIAFISDDNMMPLLINSKYLYINVKKIVGDFSGVPIVCNNAKEESCVKIYGAIHRALETFKYSAVIASMK
jgi:hypothetical protein